jgi:hypothetical protein
MVRTDENEFDGGETLVDGRKAVLQFRIGSHVPEIREHFVDRCFEQWGRAVDSDEPFLHPLGGWKEFFGQAATAVYELGDALEVSSAFCIPL